nr:hypothetical protein [Tanacetum cinerariifolium]
MMCDNSAYDDDQSAGRPAAASRGGGTGGRMVVVVVRLEVVLVIRVTVELMVRVVTKVKVKEMVGIKMAMPSMTGDVGNATEGNDCRGCTYKEFLACNPKEDSQRVKYTAGSFVGKALMWWNSEIYAQRQEAAVGMSWEDFKTLNREEFCLSNEMQKLERMVAVTEPKTIQKVAHIADTLIVEALRNGTLKKNPEKRGNIREPSKDRNGRGDNKRTRTGNAFATTANPVRGDCRVVPRNVNPINAKNPVTRTRYEGRGHGNQENQARGRAFMLGVEEARQDPNIVTDIEPSDLGFSYEIKIASGQLVKIDKVIRGCKLEIEGHVFDINLIPFGSKSFDVIIGMDWLSDHKAEIICHEKIVRIQLLDGKEATEMATGLMDKKIRTYAERQAANKRKFEDTSRNNQGRQQPPKRQDVARAYVAGSGNRSLTNANVANNQRGNEAGQKVTCYECGAQGHFKRYCPKLKNNNNNRGNQVGTGNAQARVYAVGNAGINPNANTVT